MAKIRFEYTGFGGCQSVCQLEINHSLDLVICTELNDNPGTSITNAAESLAFSVCEQYNLNPNKLLWIERYCHESYNQTEQSFKLEREIKEGPAEICALATFRFTDGKRFDNVKWHYIPPSEMAKIRSIVEA